MRKTLLFLLVSALLSSCSWINPTPEIATVLGEHFQNKLYKKFDTVTYDQVFNKLLVDYRSQLANPKVISAFYRHHQSAPKLVTQFFTNGHIDSLNQYLTKSYDDGFNPEVFKTGDLIRLSNILNENKFKKIEEVYPVIAELELKTADAILKYRNAMKFGAVNPQRVFDTYHIPVNRPDSTALDSILNHPDLLNVLRDAQSNDPSYLALKRALADQRERLNNEDAWAIKTIKINLERLRWQSQMRFNEVVKVNIPDFSLTWFKDADTLSHMNVCVGAKREQGYAEKWKVYTKSKKLDDKPKNHETPLLLSVFNAIQVNPIWNIPVSIAQSEIYYQALKDPYYLSNNNIRVYYKGKLVADPDTIRWNTYSREKLPFQFKQGSGDGNALGKFKFIFDNSFSIYLHDTNNKNGFRLKNRAISHGCIRVERPLDFAALLVKDEQAYDNLRMEVNMPPIDTTRNEKFRKILAKKADTLKPFQLKPTWFATKKEVHVLIDYLTAWVENGEVQFRPDVYEYDVVLWERLKRYM